VRNRRQEIEKTHWGRGGGERAAQWKTEKEPSQTQNKGGAEKATEIREPVRQGR